MSLGQGKIIGLAGSAEYNVIMLIRALAKKEDSYHWKMIKHKSSEYLRFWTEKRVHVRVSMGH